MKTNWFKRTLCSIFALVLVLGYVPVQTIAAESDGLCEHHTQHTTECGYSPAVEAHDCGHEHTDDCYNSVTACVHVHEDCGYVPAMEGHGCDCQPNDSGEIVHTEGCGYVEAAAEVPCSHVCSEETGCVTKVLNCQHQHDAACGYAEEAAETPCGFECEQCIQTSLSTSGNAPIMATFSSEAYSTDYPNTWKNTGNQAYDIAQIALTQVGYSETGTNHTKYNEWYYGYDQSAEWCAIFVSWCANQAGVSTIKKSTYAYPGDFGITASPFGSLIPQTGDIVFFENNGKLNYGDVYGYDHVGIVYSVDNTYIYTVEGNKGDKVQTRKYLVSTGAQENYPSTYIAWIGRPEYAVSDANVFPTLSISGWRQPTQIAVGSNFGLRGTISTDCGVITSVVGAIRNSNGTIISSHTDTPGTSSYDIQDGINKYLIFGNLSEGYYYIDVQATANNNGATNTQSLIYQQFVVGNPSVGLPSAPTNFTATYVDNERARLSWSPSTGATSYEVQYWSQSNNAWKSDTSYSSGTSYTSTGLRDYASWQFRVRAVNSAGSSDWVTCEYNKSHTHNFVIESEAAHPHKEYKKCNSCGYWEYTGNTIDVSSCEQCHPVLFYLDLNGYLDNSTSPDLAGFGTCDIYINGELVADDCTDFFNQQIPAGSTYEIRDIRATDGHNYAGVYAGQLSGIVGSHTEVILKFFSNPKATLSQNTTDIVVEKYGAYITYSYTGDTAHGYGYTIESSNPAVATVSFRGDNAIAVYGVSVGTCKIVFQLVETDTNIILDTAECTVEVSRAGTFGDGLKYNVTSDGQMTISGNGNIPDYNEEVSPWADWCSEIKTLTLSNGITGIGWSAFLSCDSLTEVTIANTVTDIEPSAFARCTALQNVEIPGSVNTIQDGAFVGCSGLKTVTLSEGVNRLQNGVFLSCSSLKNISIPQSMSSIGSSSFYNCVSLADVHYAGSIAQWGAIRMEDGNDALKNANIQCNDPTIGGTCGENLTWTLTDDGTLTITGSGPMADFPIEGKIECIGPWKEYAAEIKALVVEDGVTSIFDQSFADCENLERVSIPDSLTEVGAFAFYGCDSLTVVTIPVGVDTIVTGAFAGCAKLTSITVAEDNLHYCDVDGVLFDKAKATLWTYPAGKEGTSYTIPGGVTTVQVNSFTSSRNLTEIILPNGLSEIGNGAFSSCDQLEKITLPDSISRIGHGAFLLCSKLKEVHYTGTEVQWSSVTIGEMNEALTTAQIIFKPQVGSVASGSCGAEGDNLAWKLTNDGTLIITGVGEMDGMVTQNIECVGPWKVYKDDIRSVVIEEGVTSIGARCFTYCTNLESVTIPGTVEHIDPFAFFGTGLKQVSIPAGVREIGHAAFSNCSSLERIVAEGNNDDADFRVVDGVLYDKDMKYLQVYPAAKPGASFTVPDSVTYIDDYACVSAQFTEVILPQGLSGIGLEAFAGCANLEKILIPSSVSRIRESAFANCNRQTTIIFDHSVTDALDIGENAFSLDLPVSTKVIVQDVKDINASINGYDWAGSNRNVSYFEKNHLDLGELGLSSESSVWIDGVEYPIQKDDTGSANATLPDGAHIMVTYPYNNPNATDVHTQYPTGMKVWKLKQENGVYTATYVPELDNLLQYSGSSIRITGNKGIRMITSINQDTRNKLTGNSLAGFKLLEYGTLLAQTSKLGNDPLVLGGANVKSNYAYKKDVADPVFKYADGLIQYTNVLIGFTDEQCKEDIAMRPYMKLLDENGEEFVIYGGIVYRSIGYIAYQNRNAFQPRSAAYEYVWSIIHNVYGNQYDSEYKK